jgi:hypothetical protein
MLLFNKKSISAFAISVSNFKVLSKRTVNCLSCSDRSLTSRPRPSYKANTRSLDRCCNITVMVEKSDRVIRIVRFFVILTSVLISLCPRFHRCFNLVPQDSFYDSYLELPLQSQLHARDFCLSYFIYAYRSSYASTKAELTISHSAELYRLRSLQAFHGDGLDCLPAFTPA